jgi:hypothetical protein
MDFRKWHNKAMLLNVPHQIKPWKKSWKKYYVAYMIETDKYFVYPFVSYTNELGEAGVHYNEQLTLNTVSLYTDLLPRTNFQPFENADYLYDAFFELKPATIELNGKKIKVEFDLSANKHLDEIKEDYFVSGCRYESEIMASFDNRFIPYELNILQNQKGNSFFLYKKSTVKESKKRKYEFELITGKRKFLVQRDMLLCIMKRLREKIHLFFRK